MYHAQRHLVSNVIGSTDMRIEIGSTITLSPRDTLILSSDGLSDNLRVEEIIETIRKGPLEVGVKQMAEKSRRRMIARTPGAGVPSKPDDLTIIAYRPTRPQQPTARRKVRQANGAA
jgi:serine/threonine protein phosphatase PrpC